ncbi:MAG: ATP-binding cassette domain-containing protein [Desulfurococcus sp.]|uniref:ATP-binding cassette domain-containing protein n=1 Tax=Desulfurococcus sp. TaxID=51678 RepID=UPI003D114146
MDNYIYAEIRLAGYNASNPILVESKVEISNGEAGLIAGPSGSGKTVFLLSITGVLKHFFNGVVEGRVDIGGLNPLSYNDYISLPGKLGFLMQDPERQIIYPTPLDEVVALLEARGYSYEEARRKASNILESMGLLDKANEHVENLSGGEKKRLAITLSIVHDPGIILLDEPSASLDPEGINFIRKLIIERKNKGCSILLTEHKKGYFIDVIDKNYLLIKQRIIPLNEIDVLDYEKPPPCKNGGALAGEVILETRGLDIGYGKPLVRNINIYVRRGEVVALVGPNGSGKSTLLKTLAGFLKPLGGEIVKRNIRMFYKPQNPDLVFIHSSVEKEVRDVARRTGLMTENIISMFPWFQSVKNLHPLRLSHGQRRWLSLLISYAYGKDLLLLDEPTTGLDYTLYNNLVKTISELRRNRSMIISTHDPRLLADVADRVYVVRNNYVVEEEKCRVVESMYREIGVTP